MRKILLESAIVETLSQKGSMTDKELHETLKELYGEVDEREFRKILMRLEVQGVITVSPLIKDRRIVELRGV